MTKLINNIEEALDIVDSVVFDQWGVLHNGSQPYPYACTTLSRVKSAGKNLAVLSNSGKRSKVNELRIENMGFDCSLFDCVMTSGEALWRHFSKDSNIQQILPIEESKGDAIHWATGLNIELVSSVKDADGILLMGLPDCSSVDSWQPLLDEAASKGLPMYCSNPDRYSPRSDGLTVSPGTLAFMYKEMNQSVMFFGKPYLPVFQSVEEVLGGSSSRILMVGDSLEHDVIGGRHAGWKTLFVRGGLHKDFFHSGNHLAMLHYLSLSENAPMPDYCIDQLR